MDYSPPGSFVHEDSPGKHTGMGCHALLLRIFPTQRSNPSLSHYRRILYCLSQSGSPTSGYHHKFLGHKQSEGSTWARTCGHLRGNWIIRSSLFDIFAMCKILAYFWSQRKRLGASIKTNIKFYTIPEENLRQFFLIWRENFSYTLNSSSEMHMRLLLHLVSAL